MDIQSCEGGDHMTDKEQKKAAKEFAERWKGRGYEKGIPGGAESKLRREDV